MKAIISAGGRGTRMRPLTFSTNKHFIPLANKPLIQYAVSAIVEAGIKDIAFNYNPGQLDELKEKLGTGSKWGAKFTFFLQEKPLGLASIVQDAQDFIGKDPFLLHLGDNIFFGGIKPLVDHFKKEKPNGLVTILRHPENWRMGVPYFDKKGKLTKFVEKPKNPPHDFAIPGLYFFDQNVFKCFKGKEKIKPSARGELEIVSPFQWLLDHGYRVETKEFTGVWKDPGKFNDWMDTNRFILDTQLKTKLPAKLPTGLTIKGRVSLGKGVKVKNSTISGPTIIGDGVVLENAHIGPFTAIGDNCQVINSRIENSILMPGVVLRDVPRVIDESLIGENSEVTGNQQAIGDIEFFLGNKCVVKL